MQKKLKILAYLKIYIALDKLCNVQVKNKKKEIYCINQMIENVPLIWLISGME